MSMTRSPLTFNPSADQFKRLSPAALIAGLNNGKKIAGSYAYLQAEVKRFFEAMRELDEAQGVEVPELSTREVIDIVCQDVPDNVRQSAIEMLNSSKSRALKGYAKQAGPEKEMYGRKFATWLWSWPEHWGEPAPNKEKYDI